jgi:outer membrane protein OmpA-like peptidoglycan-associated protein
MNRILQRLIFCWLLLFAAALYAQKAPDIQLVEIADEVYRSSGAKSQALEQYKLALQKNPNNLKANYMAGICYLQTTNKKMSLSHFLKVYDEQPDFLPYMNIGRNLYPDLPYLIAYAYHLGENFDKAIEFYEIFGEAIQKNNASKYAMDKRSLTLNLIKRKIYECNVGKELKEKPSKYKAVSLKDINSVYPDFGPAVTADEQKIYFTSRRGTGDSKDAVDDDLYPFEDIYVASKSENDRFVDPVPVKELNTPRHESCLSISADGKTMLISRDDNNGDIFMSVKDNKGKWGKPEPIKKVNTQYRENGAFLSADGKKLFFSSDRPGGFGGTDLYFCEVMSNGKWGNPTNLGAKINTTYDDENPSLSADGKTLYFSSKGHKGMGGFDIFMATYDENSKTFKNPTNLGYPINTTDDDNFFVPSTQEGILGFFASARTGTIGDLDIFMLTENPPVADTILAQNEIFKQEEKKNEPLKDTEINDLNEDEEAKKAAALLAKEKEETEEIIATAEPAKEDVTKPDADKNSIAETPITQQLSTPKPTKEQLSASIIQPDPSYTSKVSSAEGYYAYDPKEDLIASAPLKANKNKPVSLRILVLDTETRLPLDVDLVLVDEQTKEELRPRRVRNGVYEIVTYNATSRNYQVSAVREGYNFRNTRIKIPAASKFRNTLITRNLEMDSYALNRPKILRNVYFEFDKYTLTKSSYNELDALENFLRTNPNTIIEISGHTDYIGSEAYNKSLSKKRAEAVVRYLTKKGIDPSRLLAKGYGASKPMATNDDELEGRELNRRTEFVILSK